MTDRFRAVAELSAAMAIVCGLLWTAWSLWLPVRVVGGSMRPTLAPGDVVVVGRHHRPMQGSIVLAKRPGHGAVLHRVVAIAADGTFITRGDANSVDDSEPVLSTEITGVVLRVIPVGTLLGRWRGADEVEYHDGSTEQREATTETTSGTMRSEQGWVRHQVRGPRGWLSGGSLQQLRPERSST